MPHRTSAPALAGRPETPRRPSPPPADRGGLVARWAGGLALVLAIVLVALIVLGNEPAYRVRLVFTDASGLVDGDEVMIGPANVGKVESVALTPHSQAAIVIGLGHDAAPLHRGTIARIAENGLAGIASHYVVLQPGPLSRPEIPSGGTISSNDTYSEVSLDELFDTLDPLTRLGLRNVIQGEAASVSGRAQAAGRTIDYLEPVLGTTSEVTHELARSEPQFDALLVDGARTMQALSSRAKELTELISNTDAATSAIASQSSALRSALALLPGALTRSTTTFAGLRSTLDALSPLIRATGPAARRLAPFSAALRRLAVASVPTLTDLARLIHNPTGTGDLTELLQITPSLARLAGSDFPAVVRELDASQAQLDELREYTPDVVSALSNVGQASGYYDANGHYTRTQPFFGAFGVNAQNQLTYRPPSERYDGLSVVHGRCPGGAVQPSPDGTAPYRVRGCSASTVPPGS